MKHLALAALVLAGCSQSPQYTAEQMEYAVKLPSGQTIVPSEEQLATMLRLEVVSLDCIARTNHVNIDATVRATGKGTIKRPTLFVKVGDSVKETYVRPGELAPGTLGSVASTAPGTGQARGERVPCEVIAAQDRHGRQLL